MSIHQARTIVHNPRSYSVDQVRAAAAYILGSFDATTDDLTAASFCV